MQDLLDEAARGLRTLGGAAIAFAIVIAIVLAAYRIVAASLRGIARRAAAAPLPGDGSLADEERTTRLAERRRRLDTMAEFGLRLVRWLAYVVVAAAAVSLFMPGVWNAIGGLGVGFGIAVGGAIGFGAQQLVRDYLNGILILGENPYSVGDIVAIAGVRGTVEEVGLRRTVLRDMDGTVHSVPNGAIAVASNFTRSFARVNERIALASGADIPAATARIDEVGHALAEDPAWAPRILSAPAVVRVEAVTDAGIPILVSATVRPGDQWAVAGELRRRAIESLGAAGIELVTGRRLILRRPAASAGAGPTDEELRPDFD